MSTREEDIERADQPAEPGANGPAARGLSRRQLLAKVGSVGGVGVLLPALAAGLPAAQVEADVATDVAHARHELYVGTMTPTSVPVAVFTRLLPARRGLDVVYHFSSNQPTDEQTTSTKGNLDITFDLVRPLGNMTMWNLLLQIREGNFQKVVGPMEIRSLDRNGNTVSILSLLNGWVSAITVHGDATHGWLEEVNLTCENFSKTG